MSLKQVVVARYSTYVDFPVPEGIDINDKSVVSDYDVSCGVLTIYYVDGTEQYITTFEPSEPDYKSYDGELEVMDDDYEQYEHEEPAFKPKPKKKKVIKKKKTTPP